MGAHRKAIKNGKHQCIVCTAWKKASEFPRRNGRANLYSDGTKRPESFCTLCKALRYVLYRAVVTRDEYLSMLERVNNRCEICHKDLGNEPYLDHCHETGKLRGVLCDDCNNGLGRFHDSLQFMEDAIAYLKRAVDMPPSESDILRKERGRKWNKYREGHP